MSVLSNSIYKFNVIVLEISASDFVAINRLILMFIWKHKRSKIVKTILKEKNRVRRLTLPDIPQSYGNQGITVLVKKK